jgi:hypothetical protein
MAEGFSGVLISFEIAKIGILQGQGNNDNFSWPALLAEYLRDEFICPM